MRYPVSALALLALALTTAADAQFGVEHLQIGASPPVYPSPNITAVGGWEEGLSKARAFVVQLTLEEKAGMVTGTFGPCVGNIPPIPRLDFKPLCLANGPLAIREAVYASVFPAGFHAAASWDRSLVRQRGAQMAEEFKGKGAHVALGPAIGAIGRSPFGGRNWEGFSPDAYLSGVLAEETVLGMQSVGVQACTKHYIANEQETMRMPTVINGTTVEAVSSNIDDKTMHETYLWPFANAVRAGTASLMCSYNRINGSYACQNSKALNGLLKEELGFQGYVMSDWGATHSGVTAIEAGLDMNMPGGIEMMMANQSYFGGNITAAVNNGTLAETRIDDMILRILTPYYYLKQDVGYPAIDESTEAISYFPKAGWVHQFPFGPTVDVRSNHAKLIRELGAAGTVLLKNENNALPLNKPMNIGVFGSDAADFTEGQLPYSGLSPGGYSTGTLSVGGGSGNGRFSYVVPPLDAIKARGQSYGALVQYITSNFAIINGGLPLLAPFPPDVCIVFLKSWATEGRDRTTLVADGNSTVVVETIAAVCPNTIVIFHGAAPTILPWREHANITAIIAAHMPGQETGNAIVDILWGDVNPSGKLPYTIATQESDYARNLANRSGLLRSTDPDSWQADFTEGNLIDYKEFDAANKSVAYEFGFGLSYTSFELSDIHISTSLPNTSLSRTPNPAAKILPGGNADLWKILATVSVTVKNTGNVTGATVPQLYISMPFEAGKNTPVRSLRGFEKVVLGKEESRLVRFPLMRRDLSYWDTAGQSWRLPSSAVGVVVGFSSRDLVLNGEVKV